MFPPQVQKSVAVYHFNDTTKQYPGTADATITAALLPLDRRENALEGGVYVNPHELYTEGTADVRVSDMLVIDGLTFYVKRVFTGNFGGLPHKRCTVSTETT